MNVLHLIATAAGSLAHHKLRSALTVLGMVFGVAAVVAMLAIGEGARRQALAAIQDLGLDNVLVESRRPSAVAAANQASNKSFIQRYGLTSADVDLLRHLIPGVQETVIAREVRQPIWAGSRRIDASIVATESSWARVANVRIVRGRFLCHLDASNCLAVAVVGASVIRDLVPLADPIGASIRLGEEWYTVVGVAESGRGSSGSSADPGRTIWIPEPTARARYGIRQISREAGGVQATACEYDRCILRFGPEGDVVAAGQLARLSLDRPEPRSDIAVTVPLELLESRQRTQRIFTVVMASIASISLLVGGIGIMNIMLATVLERTREIGIRRAVGARRSDIRAQFLVEALVLCLAGGAVGVTLGIGGAQAVAVLAGWPVAVTWWSIVLSAGICVVIGVAFGLYPASRAAAMTPVEALRS